MKDKPSSSRRKRASDRASKVARLAVLAASLGVAAAIPASAHAVPKILEPSKRPWFFTGAVGPSILIDGPGVFGFYRCGRVFCGGDTQLMLQFEIGGHFSGDGSGPALGAGFNFGFGGAFRFEPGLKFWYDIGPIADMAIYVTPSVQVGYGYQNLSSDRHAFNVQIGASGRVVLGNRGMLFAQLVGFDIHAKNNPLVTYNILFGGGVTF